MSQVGSVNASDVLQKYQVKQEEKKPGGELGKTEFLELMIAQMNNQSPLEPQDNSEFVAQLAQFSSVEGITNLNTTVDGMASQFRSSQALQASAMVGRDVMVPAEYATKGADEGVTGITNLPAATSSLTVSVFTETGELIQTMDLGQQSRGDLPFSWDGRNSRGEMLPAGRYKIVTEARYEGQSEQLQTYLGANVDSVSVSEAGNVTLNIAGAGSVALHEVKQIN